MSHSHGNSKLLKTLDIIDHLDVSAALRLNCRGVVTDHEVIENS